MPETMENPMVWHNSRLMRVGAVALSPYDQGLTIGLGAFETLVAVGGRPFAFDRHWERLVHSCRALGLAVPDRAAVADGLGAVAAANGHENGRLRVTVTAGPGPLGSGREAGAHPTCLIVSGPRPVWPARARIITLPWPRNERSPLAGVKSTSYAENAMALAEARRRGADEAVFPNTAGHLCEGSGSNVFLGHAGTLITPPLSDGCLAGVTRALVIDLARDLAIQVREESIPIDTLPAAPEVFLTSTTRGIQPVAHVDDAPLRAAPGPVTARLIEAWRDRHGSQAGG